MSRAQSRRLPPVGCSDVELFIKQVVSRVAATRGAFDFIGCRALSALGLSSLALGWVLSCCIRTRHKRLVKFDIFFLGGGEAGIPVCHFCGKVSKLLRTATRPNAGKIDEEDQAIRVPVKSQLDYRWHLDCHLVGDAAPYFEETECDSAR